MRSKFSNFKPFLLSVLVVTTVASCAFREDDVEEEKRKNTEQVAEYFEKKIEDAKVKESNITHRIIPKEVGSYDVELTWPESIPGVSIQIDDGPAVFPKSNKYTFNANSGTIPKVYIVALNQYRNPVDSYQFSIPIPRDLLVEDTYYWPQAENSQSYSRIKILASGTIVVGVNDSIITADFIEVEYKDPSLVKKDLANPHITTIEKNTRSSLDRAYHGGVIQINSKKIVGELTINSIGIDGSAGKKGEDASQSPDPNLNGRDTIYKAEFVPNYESPVTRSRGECIYRLVSLPEPGKNGHPGGVGGEGVPGGNSPMFILNVEDFQALRVHYLSRPGKGGLGGEGGLGGPGGIGGSSNPGNDCLVSKRPLKAADGAIGATGDSGKKAKNGVALGISGNLPVNVISNEVQNPE